MGCKTVVQEMADAITKAPTVSLKVPYVENSTLYNMTYEGLTDLLGVTGTIEAVGAGDAVAVLTEPSANNYKIAGIESGRGVTATTSAEDGIALTANIANASAAGSEILVDGVSSQMLLRRLVGGNGISLTQTSSTIEIETTSAVVSTKTVLVSEVADFPAAVAGVITLEANTDYQLIADISTSNRFVIPDGSCVLRGADRRIVTLTYTGSGNMFTYTSPAFTLKEISVSCASGTLFAPNAATSGAIEMFKVGITAATLGTVTNLTVFAAQSVTYNSITTDGWSFTGTVGAAQFVSNFVVNITAGTVVDLGTAVFSRFGISEFVIAASSGGTTWLSGAASSANMTSGSIAIIDQAITLGSITPLATITNEDARWQFTNCNEIGDTRPDGLLSFSTPTTTTILSSGTPVLVNGTWVVERTSQFTGTAAGRLTYNGEKSATLPISGRVSAEPVSGSAIQIGVYLAKNGTVISASEAYGTATPGDTTSITFLWQEEVMPNDYFEIWVENATSTVNIQVDKAILRIN